MTAIPMGPIVAMKRFVAFLSCFLIVLLLLKTFFVNCCARILLCILGIVFFCAFFFCVQRAIVPIVVNDVDCSLSESETIQNSLLSPAIESICPSVSDTDTSSTLNSIAPLDSSVKSVISDENDFISMPQTLNKNINNINNNNNGHDSSGSETCSTPNTAWDTFESSKCLEVLTGANCNIPCDTLNSNHNNSNNIINNSDSAREESAGWKVSACEHESDSITMDPNDNNCNGSDSGDHEKVCLLCFLFAFKLLLCICF